jgi:hypothetical protein
MRLRIQKHVIVGSARFIVVWFLVFLSLLLPFPSWRRWLERRIVKEFCLIFQAGAGLDDYAVKQLQLMGPGAMAILKEMSRASDSMAPAARSILERLRA